MATPPVRINPETGQIEPALYSAPGAPFEVTGLPTHEPAPVAEAPQTPAPVLPPAGTAPLGAPPGPAAPAVPDVGPDVKTTQAVQSKDFKAARAGMADADQRELEAVDTRTGVNMDKADAVVQDDATLAADRATMEQQAAAQREKLSVVKQDLVARAKQLREAHGKDYERDFMTELGKEKGAVAEFGAALSIGVGAFAASVNHTPNFAMDIIKDKMDRWASREKGRLLMQKEEIERAGQDVTQANQELKDFDTITRPQMEATVLQRAGERRKAILNQFGAREAQVSGDELSAKIQAEQAQREVQVEAGLNAKVETSNEEQNKAKRAAMASGGKQTEAEGKALGTIEAALTNVRNADKETKEYSAKDRAVIMKYAAAVRTEANTATNPTQFYNAVNTLSGSYINQLSENARARFGFHQEAIQNLERNRSGGSIRDGEMASLIEQSAKPGGSKYIIQYARSVAKGEAGSKSAQAVKAIDDYEAGPTQTDLRAEAASLLRKRPGDPALQFVLANPGDPDAAAVLAKARRQ